MSAAMQAIVEAMPDRIETFRVRLPSNPPAAGLVGYLRMERTAKALLWVARTLGSADAAAEIKRLSDQGAAIRWLLDRAEAPIPPRTRDRRG